MNQYRKINKDAKAYSFVNTKLSIPKNNNVADVFTGKLVFLGFKDYGFQPMIKVMDKSNSEELFFFPKDVIEVKNNRWKPITTLSGLDMRASPYNTSPLEGFRQGYAQYSNSTGEFTPQQVEQEYVNSGSKLKFGEWLQSNQGKKVVNDSLSVVLALINKNNNNQVPNSDNNNKKEEEEKKEFKILWMKPTTFSAILVVILVAGGIYLTYKSKTNKTK